MMRIKMCTLCCSGPDFGKLAQGEAVTAPSGAVIQPEMCMEAAVLGECITVIDCPSPAYLPALSAAMPSVNELMQDPEGKKLKAVFHIGPEDVVMHEEYQSALQHIKEAKHFAAEKQFDPCTQAPAIRKAVLLQVRRCQYRMATLVLCMHHLVAASAAMGCNKACAVVDHERCVFNHVP